MRAVELLGVVAAGVGVLLLPELVEPPQAAIAIASKRTMVTGIVRLRYIISFFLSWSVKIGLYRHSSIEQYVGALQLRWGFPISRREILRCAQDDSAGWCQDDSVGWCQDDSAGWCHPER